MNYKDIFTKKKLSSINNTINYTENFHTHKQSTKKVHVQSWLLYKNSQGQHQNLPDKGVGEEIGNIY